MAGRDGGEVVERQPVLAAPQRPRPVESSDALRRREPQPVACVEGDSTNVDRRPASRPRLRQQPLPPLAVAEVEPGRRGYRDPAIAGGCRRPWLHASRRHDPRARRECGCRPSRVLKPCPAASGLRVHHTTGDDDVSDIDAGKALVWSIDVPHVHLEAAGGDRRTRRRPGFLRRRTDGPRTARDRQRRRRGEKRSRNHDTICSL